MMTNAEMFNLIKIPWIPVVCRDGKKRKIAPWQMAAHDVLRPNWPRPDMNIACYELLIGMIFLADPPINRGDWSGRQNPDPEHLKKKLEPFTGAFNLLGDGHRFLQDTDPLEGEEEKPVDMLFIDSAAHKTIEDNKDLMVHRDRYQSLDLPTAAMALYTLQAFAPSGGSGHRTSMRGGGPMTTLVNPGSGLWDLIWANVPCRNNPDPESDFECLPWTRATRFSDREHNNQKTFPPGYAPGEDNRKFGVEAFFGMPRRIRLIGDNGYIKGVRQRKYGTNYAGWKHPLSPHRRNNAKEEWSPKHPGPGRFGYRNWLGIVMRESRSNTSELSLSLTEWSENRGGDSDVVVAGWAMDNMKPVNFIFSTQPLLKFQSQEIDQEDIIVKMIGAAEETNRILRKALRESISIEKELLNVESDSFFAETEDRFLNHVQKLKGGGDPRYIWMKDLQQKAIARFDALTEHSFIHMDINLIDKIIKKRKSLLGFLFRKLPKLMDMSDA
ncbi:MAG: type I-E CRISPR-associated protein Cse1/CasA [Rhodobacteraceae bacterium]|nr:type I-E CRISPR-associated protein Cse1/CasA [Paracoccaceae bacterium]